MTDVAAETGRKRVELVLDERTGRFLVDFWCFSADKLVVEFEVREQLFAEPGPMLYRDEHDDFTEDPEQAELYLDGAIRFDGCSNVDFKTDSSLKHFCDRGEAARIGALLARLYDLAAEMMPEHAESLR